MDKHTVSEINPLAQVHYVAKTDIGTVRSENQDHYGLVEKPNYKFYFVADGMGGAKGGAIASKLAIEKLQERLKNINTIAPKEIRSFVKVINSSIYEKGNSNRDLYGMGTTLVGLAFTNDSLLVLNVGDSRAYRLRQGKLKQLTLDHTLVGELVRSGAISEDQVENHPVSHMLTRSLGPAEDVDVDCGYMESPQAGDIYLICSDGLYNFVSDQELSVILAADQPEIVATKLVDLVNSRAGNDNITLIVITVGTEYPTVRPVIDQEETIEIDSFGIKQRKKFAWKKTLPQVLIPICLLFGYFIYSKSVQSVSSPAAPVVESISEPTPSSVEVEIVDVSLLEQRQQILARKENIEYLITRYESYAVSLAEGPAAIAQPIKELKTELNNQEVELKKITSQLDVATGRLAVWVGRRKRLASTSEINIASEIAPFSATVAKKQQEFEEQTRIYLNAAEDLRYQPHNTTLAANVQNLINLRKEALSALRLEVIGSITAQVNQTEHDIAELSIARSNTNIKIENLTNDLQFLENLTSNPQNAKQAQTELQTKISIYKSELQQLNELLDSISN